MRLLSCYSGCFVIKSGKNQVLQYFITLTFLIYKSLKNKKMRTINPVKIGKYTFWISFAIGNIFLLGALACNSVSFWNKYVLDFVVYGFLYLIFASAVNILIIIFLFIHYLIVKENLKNYLTAVGYIVLNIPIAALYAFIGNTYILNL